MEARLALFDELITTKNSIKEASIKKATELLWAVYQETTDTKLLCEKLYNAAYKIGASFIENHYFDLAENSRQDFINNFIVVLHNTKVEAKNLEVGFNIVAGIVNLKAADISVAKLLSELVKGAEVRKKFSIPKCEALNEYLLEKTKGDIFTLDYSGWTQAELEVFCKFLVTTYQNPKISFKYQEKLEQWLAQYNFAPLTNLELENISTKKAKTTKVSPTVSPSNNIDELKKLFEQMFSEKIQELMTDFTATKNEMQKFNQRVFEKNTVLDLYAEKLHAKEQELIAVKKLMLEKDKRIDELAAENLIVNKSDDKYKAEIEDLTARLKVSFHADDITKKQELITLKKNIGSALKLRYDKFMENQNAIYSEDNYEVLRASIHQIFRVLKRYGIEL